MFELCASILAADFANLERDMRGRPMPPVWMPFTST